jgi:two-component system response regulator YesN
MRSGGLLAIVAVKQAELAELHADLTKVCSSYVKACRTYFYCQLSCYIGITSEIERIPGSYRHLTQAERNNVPSNGRVYRIGDTDSRKDAVPEPPVGIWAEILKNGAKAKLLEHIRQFMQLWKQAQSLDGSRLQRFYQDFLHMLYHTLQLKGLQAFEVFGDAISQERALLVVRSVNALEEWALEMAEKAFVHVREAEERQSVVERVRQYIQLNIDHELTREELGKQVGFNADYIAKLFKKETGLSINDYVVQERVALAEQLLSSTDLPVNSVALAVGYSNFSYFSKVFRKATNLNPQQFRKQRIGALNR